MKKSIVLIACVVLFVLFSVEIRYGTEDITDSVRVETCGPSSRVIGRAVREAFSLLKACKSSGKIAEEIKPPIKPLPLLSHVPAMESLVKELESINASSEVVPKIEEYLSQTTMNEGGVKTIACFKQDAEKIRVKLYDGDVVKLNKIVKATSQAIDLSMYDITAMQESFYKGSDGAEYVIFRIPKRPQALLSLSNDYQERVYECLVFNLPKDTEGNWKKFKEFLIALWNDILNRPDKLWDEYMFRRGLSKLNINSRDVQEIQEYRFACIFKPKRDVFENNLPQIA